MTLVYANSTDLATWLGTAAPANATQLLRSASIIITDATLTAFYATDPVTMLPTDATILQAFKDATCAQAAAWIATGVDPNADGLAGAGGTAPLRAKRIGTGSLEYDTSMASSQWAFDQRKRIASELCDEARRILQQAQLFTTAVWRVG